MPVTQGIWQDIMHTVCFLNSLNFPGRASPSHTLQDQCFHGGGQTLPKCCPGEGKPSPDPSQERFAQK